MELYIPSLFLMILAAGFAFFLIPKFTPIILAIFATACLVLAIYNHSSIFFNEYKNMSWANTASASLASPYVIVITVILLSVGYIIYLFTMGKAPSLSYSYNIPPPATATNIVTEGIGHGLLNTGVSNVSPTNTSKAALNSALSQKI